MEDAKYLDLMAKYLSGNLAEAEREELFSWVERDARNRTFFDETIQLWSISSEYEDEAFETDTASAWNTFEKRLDQPRHLKVRATGTNNGQSAASGGTAPPGSDKPRRLSIRKDWMRYAAVILLLVAAGLWWYADPLNWWTTEYLTEAGETTTVELPDGSEVTLNASTRLAFRQWWGKRQVRMEGEAYFDVERLETQPFEILSGPARTVVLGTAFNVRAYPEEKRIEVTVERGTVRVEERDKKRERITEAVVLEAGTSAVLDKEAGALKETETVLSNASAWKTGILRFENEVPIEQVLPDLERYFGVEIEAENENLLHCPINLPVQEGQDLESIFRIIEIALGGNLRFDRLDNGAYRLSGEGCQENKNQ